MGTINIKSISEFTLNKVKRLKNDAGITVEWQMETNTDHGKTVHDMVTKGSVPPHLDLLKCLENLKQVVAFSAGLMGPAEQLLSKKNLLLDKSVKPKALSERLETYKKEVYENITVSGVSYQHKDDGFTSIITGGYTGPLGYSNHNTPLIGFEEVKHGWEEEIEEVLEDLKTEVFKYVIKGKCAQMDMFDTDSNEEKTEENEDKAA